MHKQAWISKWRKCNLKHIKEIYKTEAEEIIPDWRNVNGRDMQDKKSKVNFHVYFNNKKSFTSIGPILASYIYVKKK